MPALTQPFVSAQKQPVQYLMRAVHVVLSTHRPRFKQRGRRGRHLHADAGGVQGPRVCARARADALRLPAAAAQQMERGRPGASDSARNASGGAQAPSSGAQAPKSSEPNQGASVQSLLVQPG